MTEIIDERNQIKFNTMTLNQINFSLIHFNRHKEICVEMYSKCVITQTKAHLHETKANYRTLRLIYTKLRVVYKNYGLLQEIEAHLHERKTQFTQK